MMSHDGEKGTRSPSNVASMDPYNAIFTPERKEVSATDEAKRLNTTNQFRALTISIT